MRTALKNVSLIVALIVVVYLVGNYSGTVKNQIMDVFDLAGSSVKGASTEKAEEISGKLQTDIAAQVDTLQKYALDLTLGDAIALFSRFQQVPKDFHSIREYTIDQIANFTRKQ
ncbi:MAG TPA: hypothetical protein VLF20_01595 [Patescibacteria group bacterium]|nr:hypothetical protein [Patescibacteria group bacterium]